MGKLKPRRGGEVANSAWLGLEPASHSCASQTPLANKREELDQSVGYLAQIEGKTIAILVQNARRWSRATCPHCFPSSSLPGSSQALFILSAHCLGQQTPSLSPPAPVQAQASLIGSTATHAPLCRLPAHSHLSHILLPQLSFKNTNLMDFIFLFFAQNFHGCLLPRV